MNNGESDCCQGQLILENGKEGTSYYVCRSCGRPCGVWSKERNTMNDIDKELNKIHSVLRDGDDWYKGSEIKNLIRSLLSQETKRVREQNEQLQIQLAGCLTAAEGHTKDPAKPKDYGWSLAYQKVLELRIKFDSLREENK